MATGSATSAPPSMIGTTIRRALVVSRTYLAVGTGMSVLYALILGFIGGPAFASAFPLVLPVVSVVGGLGGMMVFTNDRTKGVYEYLIAYGISPLRIFIDTLLGCLVLETIVVGVSCGVGFGAFLARGNTIGSTLATTMILYSLPMSYASVAFAASVGMFWTSLSSPREGMNSPLGMLPIVGFAPSLLTLLLTAVVAFRDPNQVLEVTSAAILVLVLLVVLLLRFAARLMRPERLLSPA
jgi:hypothetical protein